MQDVDIPLQFIDAAVQYSIPSDIQSALNGYKNNQQSLTARQGAFGALYNNQQTRPLAYSFVGNNVGYDDMNKAVTDMFKKSLLTSFSRLSPLLGKDNDQQADNEQQSKNLLPGLLSKPTSQSSLKFIQG